ncbi:hypothetical protein [Microbacterium gubbeenense]|uniref:hypothetical protein n=1 Tax=Microbacterium gubbeenense TaxID=159896 RepID=UPI000685FB25|nr:hypothetical protein [Microbacterium gubbeenense]
MADTPSALELVQTLRRRGLSNSEIAGELDRHPRMVHKILRGETSGKAYQQALSELASTGHVTHRPPRRRNKAGNIVPVRSRRGARTKTVVPTDTAGRYATERQGGRYAADTTYLGEGGRIHQFNIPKGKDTKGRRVATDAILDKVRSAARGQSKDTQKRVRMQLTFSNGRVMEVKDYNASSLLDRINTLGDHDALEWLADQASTRYGNLNTARQTITGVTMTVYNSQRTDASSRAYKPRGA